MSDDTLILFKLATLLLYDCVAIAVLIWGAYVVLTTWRSRR